MWQLAAGVFLGWSLGSNDAANVFGTAVASRMVRFATAALLCGLFVIVGAAVGGAEGMLTYRKLSPLSPNLAFVVSLSAALTVAAMSRRGLPVSTSQAVVGALVLAGAVRHSLDLSVLGKVVTCWVATPVAAALTTVVVYFVLGKLMNLIAPTIFWYDRGLRLLLVAGGSYGAFALGANNVANVTGPFVGPDMLTPHQACLLGGVAIALGVAFSRRVMMTVGRELVRLDAFTAFVAIVGEAVTVHLFSEIGVPVSTSQAIVGSVFGIGLVKGVRTINWTTLWRILFGWVGTPTISALVAAAVYFAFAHFGAL